MLSDIEKEFSNLEKFNLNDKNISDTETLYATSMSMLSIITRMINIAEEIVVKNEWGMPSVYQELFSVLNKNGIIGKELADELSYLVKQRNVMAHYYFDVKPKDILSLKKKIYSVRQFAENVKSSILKDR